MQEHETDFTTKFFTLHVLSTEQIQGVTYVRLHATDRFSGRRHAFERRAFGLFTGGLEAYLRRHPHLGFDHPRNFIRNIIYLPPALRSWAAYMPGGFATYHVHNPDHKRLANGKRIDYLTRNLFRHATDAIGLRSRAYAMNWYVHGHFREHAHINWLSIACGTGQPTFDAARLFTGEKTFYMVDLDKDALAFARQLAGAYGIDPSHLITKSVDLTDAKQAGKLLQEAQPHIIEAMGLFEYLDKNQAVTLLRTIRKLAPRGGVFVFTNMHVDHPQLQTHQRGLGWPGVTPRTTDEVLALLQKAGYNRGRVTVMLPDDHVYAVYGIVL